MIDTVDLSSEEWGGFVGSQTLATAFHHPAWARVITSVYGFRSQAVVWRGADGQVSAGMPAVRVLGLGRGARWRCLPFTDRCGPLGEPQAVEDLLAALASRTGERWEVRDAAPTLGHARPVALAHRLDLTPGAEALYRGFHSSQVQRAIRKVQREQRLTVREAACQQDLTGTYYALHVATRKRQGVPPQPRRLFAALWRNLHEAGLATTWLVELDGEAVAGAVFLDWNGTVIYKYGASLERAWQARPNHLIFWTAIQRASEEGRRWMDFGRTDFDNSGLSAFKRNWGAVEETLYYSTSARVSAASAHGPGHGVLAAMIRRSPPRLCEWLGSALYRFAA